MSAEPRRRAHPGWHGHAFGLAIASSFPLVGFPSRDAPLHGDLAPIELAIADERDLRAAFAHGSRPIGWRRGPDGTPRAPDLLSHAEEGYLMSEPAVGHFSISSTGERILCAPAGRIAWRWQRYLLGRVLPFATTLRGLEPWHAAAVSLRGGAIAIIGGPGLGKSTIAAEMVLAGARLLADDVIALQSAAGAAIVHPGPPLLSLRTRPRSLFATSEIHRLGPRVGAEAGALRLSVERAERPAPLRAVYLLERARREAPSRGDNGLTALPGPDPARLIGATFNFALRSADRLRRQLEVAAQLAGVPCVEARVAPQADLRGLGRRILADARARTDAAGARS